jgi:hypothetical protein
MGREMKSQLAEACVVLGILGFVPSAFAEEIACPPSDDPLARGYCSKAPEGGPVMVRAKGSVDTATGRVTLTIELETDDATTGPCATASVTLRDAAGVRLSTIQMQHEACLGGKPAEQVLIKAFTYTRAVSPEVAQATTSVDVSASKTRQISRVWNANFEEAIKAIRLIQTVVGAMH